MEDLKSVIRFVICVTLVVCMSGQLMAGTPTYNVPNISHRLGDVYNSMKGLCFDISIAIDDNKGGNVLIYGKLSAKNSNGDWVDVPFTKQVSSSYACVGDIAMAKAKSTLNCCCPVSVNSKYEIFLPYDAITHPKGKVNYKITFWMEDANGTDKFIPNKNGGYYHNYYFSLNWPQENRGISQPSTASQASQSGNIVRQNIPTGGYVEYIPQANGGMMTKMVQPCNICHGSKVCPSCLGAKGRWGAAYGGTWYPCPVCGGDGKNHCRACQGKGEIVTVSFVDQNMNGFGISSNGTVSQSNPAGTVVSTPYGTKVYPSGDSNYSSSGDKPSSGNDYVEQIVYTQCYTGDCPDEWCEKCKKVGRPHVHIKKRVP